MEWSAIISNILDYTGYTLSYLSEFLNVDYKYLHAIKNGKSKNPKTEFIKILVEKLGINPSWLLTGEGEMFLPGRDTRKKESLPEDSAEAENCKPGLHLPTEQPDQIKCNTMLHIPAEAPHQSKTETVSVLPAETTALSKSRGLDIISGGGGGEIADPREIVVYRFQKGHPVPMEVREPDPEGAVLLPLWSQPTAAGPGQMPTQLAETERSIPVLYTLLGYRRPENCALVRVVGDSMSDVGLFNGDYVLFDRSDRSGDGIFVISLFGETRVKRLQYRLADKKIIIASENTKRYPEPEIVPFDFIQDGSLVIHGRVFAWLHRHPY